MEGNYDRGIREKPHFSFTGQPLEADLRRGTVDDWQYFFPNQSESERMFRVWG